MSKEIITDKELGEAIYPTAGENVSKKEAVEYASNLIQGVAKSLLAIENSETSIELSLLTFCNLCWLPSEGWALHGEGFDGEPPQVTESLELMPAFEINISNCTGIGIADVRYYLRCLNELIDKRLDECRDTKTKFNLFNLGILIADHDRLSFTPFSRLAADNPTQYVRSMKLDAEQGFTSEKGRFLRDLNAEACSLLLKKVSSRIRKKSGDVVGRDTRPFHVPPAVSSLDSEALSVLAGHRGYLDTSSIHELDAAAARALSAYEGCTYREEGKWSNPYMYRLGYTLGGLTELSEEVAAELSLFDDEKPAWVTELMTSGEYSSARISHDFSGLTSISPEVLRRLAKLNGHLDLSGLGEFDKEHAEALHDHVGGVLLNGLTSMSPDVAEELAKMKPGQYYVDDGWQYGAGLIDLSGMLNLDAQTCSNLLNFDGSVSLGCFDVLTADLAEVFKDHGYRIFLKWLSHEQAAEEILSHQRGLEGQFEKGVDWREPTLPMAECGILTRSLNYGFPGQICISRNEEVAAELLSKYERDLYLNDLTTLSDAAAESLSKHEGDLDLSGLTTLTDAAAESLSKHEGGLFLNGLTSLTESAAEYLSGHKWDLDLDGLISLSDAAAESLSRHVGELHLESLTTLSDAAADSLSKHKGEINWEDPAEWADSLRE